MTHINTTHNTIHVHHNAPLGSIHADYPLQVNTVDMIWPIPESMTRNSYILVAGEYFARCIEAYPMPDKED